MNLLIHIGDTQRAYGNVGPSAPLSDADIALVIDPDTGEHNIVKDRNGDLDLTVTYA